MTGAKKFVASDQERRAPRCTVKVSSPQDKEPAGCSDGGTVECESCRLAGGATAMQSLELVFSLLEVVVVVVAGSDGFSCQGGGDWA